MTTTDYKDTYIRLLEAYVEALEITLELANDYINVIPESGTEGSYLEKDCYYEAFNRLKNMVSKNHPTMTALSRKAHE